MQHTAKTDAAEVQVSLPLNSEASAINIRCKSSVNFLTKSFVTSIYNPREEPLSLISLLPSFPLSLYITIFLPDCILTILFG